jgi:hypothetical protein
MLFRSQRHPLLEGGGEAVSISNLEGGRFSFGGADGAGTRIWRHDNVKKMRKARLPSRY